MHRRIDERCILIRCLPITCVILANGIKQFGHCKGREGKIWTLKGLDFRRNRSQSFAKHNAAVRIESQTYLYSYIAYTFIGAYDMYRKRKFSFNIIACTIDSEKKLSKIVYPFTCWALGWQRKISKAIKIMKNTFPLWHKNRIN